MKDQLYDIQAHFGVSLILLSFGTRVGLGLTGLIGTGLIKQGSYYRFLPKSQSVADALFLQPQFGSGHVDALLAICV